jgi:hypothetical protein
MLEPGNNAAKEQPDTRPWAGTPRDEAAVTGRAAAERRADAEHGRGAEQGEHRDGELMRVEEPAEYDIESMAQWAHWV